LDDAGHGKTENNGYGSGDQIQTDGLGADTAQLFAVAAQTGNAYDSRAGNNRNDHHLDEVNEDGTDRRNPFVNERKAFGSDYQTGAYRQDQRNQNLDR
jgi:hypothetical protein